MADDAGAKRGPKSGLTEEVLEFETSEDVDVTPTFDSLGLREELLRGVYAYGAKHAIRLFQF
jgi:ATP-dependent RNA helicase